MNIKPIRNKADYKAALAEVDGLMRARLGTPEGDKLDGLVTFIEAYETRIGVRLNSDDANNST
jgi:HTH-type transcriptional regulator/antitoxin HigA